MAPCRSLGVRVGQTVCQTPARHPVRREPTQKQPQQVSHPLLALRMGKDLVQGLAWLERPAPLLRAKPDLFYGGRHNQSDDCPDTNTENLVANVVELEEGRPPSLRGDVNDPIWLYTTP